MRISAAARLTRQMRGAQIHRYIHLNDNSCRVDGICGIEGELAGVQSRCGPVHVIAALVISLICIASQTRAQQSVQGFDPGAVQLLNGSYYNQMLDVHRSLGSFFSSLEVDGLLYEFRKQAGLPQPPGAVDLDGRWEGDPSEFGFTRGCMTGHYLTAASRMYAITGDSTYLNNVSEIVAGLSDVQDAYNNNGYVSALPESAYTALENEQMSFPSAWVPYYTEHKILAGLRDAHTFTGSQQALDVAFDEAQYFVDRVNGLPEFIVERMVKSHENQGREFGGMNEVLTDLYVKASAVNDSRAQGFLNLANVFNNRTFMDQLAAGNDVLNGIHANTHIPQAIGWARYGDVTGDQDATNAAVNFWDIVVRDHTFVTGGNSFAEYFHAPGEETGLGGASLTARTGEGCNVYNMLKLTRELFERSPDQKYAAYAENALINHILPSVEPQNGVSAYFLSMRPGHYKTYHTFEDAYWCDSGSGIERPSYYADMTYFKDDDSLYVNTFMPSQVTWGEKGVTLTQAGDSTSADESMHMTVNTGGGPKQAAFKIRIPSWAYGDAQVTINGQPYQGQVNRGEYVTLDRQWQDGDEIDITLDKKLYLRRSKDDPNMVSVYYGAVLLAGELGTQNIAPNNQMVVNEWDYAEAPVPFSVPDIDAADADPESWLLPVPGEEMQFEMYDNGVATGIIFRPFYETHHERYSIYWELDAPNDTRTWRGGGSFNSFQDPTNWDLAPAAGDSLAFDGDLSTTVDNNYADGTEFNHVEFKATAAAFTVAGNRIALRGNVTNSSPNVQTVNADLSLQVGNHLFHAGSGDIVVGGQLSGGGGLVKSGAHRLTLLGDNIHASTTINQGELQVGNGGTTGSLGSGDVTLANNATVAFNRGDDAEMANSVSGNGSFKKLGQGTLTVIKQQQYTGQTIIEGGTLRIGSGSTGNGTFVLNFNTVGGTIDDAQGQGTGFSRRLAGTLNPAIDPKLDINVSAGELLLTSGGPADFNGANNLGNIEAPGINLSDLGLGAESDFSISASFEDAPSAANFRQYGIYIGDSAQRLLRGGYLDVNGHNVFGVNNTGSSANDSSLALTTAGAPIIGGNVEVVLSRTAGVFSLTVNGTNVTPSVQMTELNDLSDLTLGVFSLHTSNNSGQFTVPLTQFTISSPDLPADEIFHGSLPSTTDVVIASGATLDLNGMSQMVGSITGVAGSQIVLGGSTGNVLIVNESAGSTLFAGSISGQGGLVKSGGATQILGGVNSYVGNTTINGGTLALSGAAAITSSPQININPGAKLDVAGLTGVFTLAAGQMLSNSNAAVVGNMVVAAGSTVTGTGAFGNDLNVDAGAKVILGIAESGVNDLFAVAGNLALANGFALQIVLDGSVPAASLVLGDTWNLFDFATSSGSYDGDADGFILPSGLASGLEWDASRLLVDGTLSVSSVGLLGDYNDNGVIDAADYTVWRDNLGGTIPHDPTGGVATQDDYNYWKTHFGETLGSGPGGGSSTPAVPEPAPAILLLIVAPVLLRGALGRRRR